MGRTTWTKEQKDFIRENIHLTNEELAQRLGKTKVSVENKVRELGLARTFRPEEIEILKEVWGKRRNVICNALPRFTWVQIRKKAHRIGLPSVNDAMESVYVYSIIAAMGVSESMLPKWKAAGLCIMNDRIKSMQKNIQLVNVDKFWKFAIKHPELVDYTKLGENVFDLLGSPPKAFVSMSKKSNVSPTCVKHTVLRGEKRRELAKLYYSTHISAKKIALSHNISLDTLYRIATEYRNEFSKRSRATTVTPNFLKQLNRLYYQEGRTHKECADILNCSESSVYRGLMKLIEQGQANN